LRTMRVMSAAEDSVVGTARSLGLNVMDLGVMMVQQRGGYEMNSSSSSAPPARQCPVQLDLLPGLRPASVTPAAAPSSTNNTFSWQPASLRNGSRTNSGSGADLSFVPRSSCCQHSEVLEILNFFVFVCLLWLLIRLWRWWSGNVFLRRRGWPCRGFFTG
jgi:hypothetical protein